MKKLLLSITIIIAFILGIKYIYDSANYKPCKWHEGDVSSWQGVVGKKKAYELALSDKNLPVFKNPEEALKQLKKDYKKTIKEIRKQFDLDLFLNKYTYESYHNLAWQIVTDDNKLSNQTQKVSYILGIYENSYKACK